jgi:hypothetical protein
MIITPPFLSSTITGISTGYNLINLEGLLPAGVLLWKFQIKCANVVLGQLGNIVFIAPTGAGKSLLWHFPLSEQPESILLVIIPYTSLGLEGEAR